MSKIAKFTAVAATCLASGWISVQADTQSVSREQVRGELAAARVSGQMEAVHGEDSGSAWLSRQYRQQRSILTAEQRSAGLAALAAALIGEDSGSAYLSAQTVPSERTRAQVKAEVAQARASGELYAMMGEDSGAAFLARQHAWMAALYAGPGNGPREPPAMASPAG